MASDSIDQLSRIVPVSDQEAARVFGPAGKENLLDAITALGPSRERTAFRRLRRPLVLVAAVIVIASATGAAWALTHDAAQTTTSVDCVVQGVDSIVDATSGDPAADCATVWQSLTGHQAPPLTAYDNGLGGVAVLPSSETPPAGWTPIVSQNVALIELQQSLLDNINGLDSGCFSQSAATTYVQQQLDALGLGAWTIDVNSDSTGQCYGGYADGNAKTVFLGTGSDQSGAANWPPRRLADSLRPLTSQCLSLDAMKREVIRRATVLGMSQTVNYELAATQDNTMRCATVVETVGGTIDVAVRGPAAP